MPSKLNSEFNYRYMVIGETPWEKIKTLKGFLEGRIRAAALQEVGALKTRAIYEEIDHLKATGAPKHQITTKEAELVELESHNIITEEAFELNRQEIECLKRLLDEYYEYVEPTRIAGYTDEQMFEVNAVQEFTVKMIRDLQSEIIAQGRPNPATIRNAMSNPTTLQAIKVLGFIPEAQPPLIESQEVQLLLENATTEPPLDCAAIPLITQENSHEALSTAS